MPSLRESWSKWRSRADRLAPTRFQAGIWLCLACLVFALSLFAGTGVSPVLEWGGWFVMAAFAVISIADFWQIRSMGYPEVHRSFGGIPQIGQPLEVRLDVEWRGQAKRGALSSVPAGASNVQDHPSIVSAQHRLEFDAGMPDSFLHVQTTRQTGWEDAPSVMSSTSGASGTSGTSGSTYRLWVQPTKRGVWTCDPVDCRWQSPFKLWTRMRRSGLPEEVTVRPDISSWLAPVEALKRTLVQEGRHVKRFASGDSDFAHIAEYSIHDDPRTVNWAATARRNRLMKNVFEPERGQHIILALDASRYMGVQLPDGKTRLDHAVNCATALAHTAIGMGDEVGLVAFSNELTLRLPPAKGQSQWRAIVDSLSGLEAKPVQGGYQALFSGLSGQFRRRSLLIVLSEMEGLATDAEFLPALRAARLRHPTVFVSVSPVHLDEILRRLPKNDGDIGEWAAAEWMLEERDNLQDLLRRARVELVESRPGGLITRAVSLYLRRRERAAL